MIDNPKPGSKKTTADKLLAKALKLVKDPDDLLELGITLWELQEVDSSYIKEFFEAANYSSRKSYYLVDVGKAFYNLPVTKEKAKEIGWTKLSKIAPYITAENWQEMIALAEKHKTVDLERVLKDQPLVDNEKILLMRLDGESFAKVEDALIKFGATKTKSGLSDKEQALMKLIDSLK